MAAACTGSNLATLSGNHIHRIVIMENALGARARGDRPARGRLNRGVPYPPLHALVERIVAMNTVLDRSPRGRGGPAVRLGKRS